MELAIFILKWIFRVIVGLAVLLVAVSMFQNYVATHNGPFVYFRELKPELSSWELADYGSTQIGTFANSGITGAQLDQYLRDIGIPCKKISKNFSRYQTSRTDIDSYNSCSYWFGIFGSTHAMRISYIIERNGSVSDVFSDVVCPACSGV